MKNKKMRLNKGFTLIELLAVIIILGIIMLIAIPSVTRLINDSRKKTYIDTAKQYIKGATTLVNSGELDVYDTGTTYYIPSSCINVESGGQSPYGGEFAPAYILVTYDNNSYNFYWMSTDNQKMGIKTPTSTDKLEVRSVEPNVAINDVSPTIGIDGRNKIVEFDSNCSSIKETRDASKIINSSTGEIVEPITYPEGKDKSSLEVGDFVTINNEKFFVVSIKNDDIALAALYNLKVGGIYTNGRFVREYNSSDTGYGKQSSEARGFVALNDTYYGTVPFSNSRYWDNYETAYNYPANSYYYPDIYDENSLLTTYINNYANSLGINVKQARIMTFQEMNLFYTYPGIHPKLSQYINSSFWLGSGCRDNNVWVMTSYLAYNCIAYNDAKQYGIKPLIVI